MSDRHCPCGRGLQMLEEVEGRDVDTVRTPDGRTISGIVFPHLFMGYPYIIAGQIVQHELDQIEILIRVDSEPSADELEVLRRDIQSYTGPEVTLTIKVVDELISNPTRKYRFVVSKL